MNSSATRPQVPSTGRPAASSAWLAPLALGLVMALGHPASAQPCFPPPQGVPGLQGAPNWAGGSTPVRAERDEPRWAPAPVQAFANDVFGSLEGGYRLLYDTSTQELVIALQMYADLGGTASQFDSVYLGLTQDASGASAEAVRIVLPTPSGGADPVPLGGGTPAFVHHQFSGGAWTLPGGAFPSPTAPPWLSVSHAWVAGGMEWAVHVKVRLADLGLSETSPFRIALGIHSSDDVSSAAIDLSSPDVGLSGGVDDLFTMPPSGWLLAGAPNAGCPGGITLSSMQIGTTNPSPHQINTTAGATNTFFAAPSVPAGMVTSANQIQARFRIANWGIVASPTAGWNNIPNAGAVPNGVNTAPNNNTVHFVCPANSGGQVCGMAPPSTTHQCMLVELSKVPSSPASPVFTKAAAYRNMDFVALSEFADQATINVAGLQALLGNADARTIYLHIKRSNMPGHGDSPVWLRPAAMGVLRRMTEDPTFQLRSPEDARALMEAFDWRDLMAEQSHAIKVDARAPMRLTAALGSKAPRTAPSLQNRPWPLWGYSDHALLTTLWPTYEVHGYYEVGLRKRPDGSQYMRLQPMVPFAYFLEHDGPLYGFTDSLSAAGFTELRPDLYRATLGNESSTQIGVRLGAEESPKGQGAGSQCPECKPVIVDGCGRCAVGASRGARPLTVLGILAVLGLLGMRRRRRG